MGRIHRTLNSSSWCSNALKQRQLFEFASPDKSLGKDSQLACYCNREPIASKQVLADQPEIPARLQATFGRVYSWLDESRKAASLFGLAAEQLERLRGVQDHKAIACREQEPDNHIRLGNYPMAETMLQTATDRLAERTTRIPSLANELKRKQSNLAHVRGDAARAERLLHEVLDDCLRRPEEVKQLRTAQHMLTMFLQHEHRHREAQSRFDTTIATRCAQRSHRDDETRLRRSPSVCSTHDRALPALATTGESRARSRAAEEVAGVGPQSRNGPAQMLITPFGA